MLQPSVSVRDRRALRGWRERGNDGNDDDVAASRLTDARS